MALAVKITATTIIQRILVRSGINNAPQCGADGRHHSYDTPIRGKVLYAPYDGDDDRGKGEGASIAEADEGRS